MVVFLSASTVSPREQPFIPRRDSSPRVPSSRTAMQWVLGREVPVGVKPIVLCCRRDIVPLGT